MAFNIEKESINPHYRFLIRAMKRKAAEEAEGPVLYSRIIRASGDSAWMVLCMKDADTSLVLLYGVTSTNPVVRELYEKGDVGVTISTMPFDSQLLPLLSMAVSLKDDDMDSCKCHHRFDRRTIRLKDSTHAVLAPGPGSVCPACGSTEQDMDFWEFAD